MLITLNQNYAKCSSNVLIYTCDYIKTPCDNFNYISLIENFASYSSIILICDYFNRHWLMKIITVIKLHVCNICSNFFFSWTFLINIWNNINTLYLNLCLFIFLANQSINNNARITSGKKSDSSHVFTPELSNRSQLSAKDQQEASDRSLPSVKGQRISTPGNYYCYFRTILCSFTFIRLKGEVGAVKPV